MDALSSKMADFNKSYHELKSQGLKVSENPAATEEQVEFGKQREKDLSIERSRLLDEREELKDIDTCIKVAGIGRGQA